jgi:uncharacterized damage-inducible protein DinB
MQIAEMQKLIDYNYWANKRLLEPTKLVSQAQFVAPAGFPFGGLRGTLVHIFDAEYTWRMMLEKGVQTGDTPETDFANAEVLVKRWGEEEAAMRAYVAGLRDEDLTGVIRYTTSTGIKRERVIWHCLYHVVNHGTQHRSEAAAILTALGHSPGDVDFTVFLNG